MAQLLHLSPEFGLYASSLENILYSLHFVVSRANCIAHVVLYAIRKFRRRLRSADVDTCIVPRTRTRFGDRSFPAAGPRI